MYSLDIRIRCPNLRQGVSQGTPSLSAAFTSNPQVLLRRLGHVTAIYILRNMWLTDQIESFLHLYAHITPPADLAPVTDILCFASRIQRPGIWEEMVK